MVVVVVGAAVVDVVVVAGRVVVVDVVVLDVVDVVVDGGTVVDVEVAVVVGVDAVDVVEETGAAEVEAAELSAPLVVAEPEPRSSAPAPPELNVTKRGALPLVVSRREDRFTSLRLSPSTLRTGWE